MLTVTGLDEAIEETEEMGERLLLLDVLDDVAGMIRADMDERFATATAPDGTAWPTKEDGSRADLGTIRDTLFAEAEATSIQYGARHPAASYHQDGTEHLPARPFAPTEQNAPALMESIGEAIENYLAGQVGLRE